MSAEGSLENLASPEDSTIHSTTTAKPVDTNVLPASDCHPSTQELIVTEMTSSPEAVHTLVSSFEARRYRDQREIVKLIKFLEDDPILSKATRRLLDALNRHGIYAGSQPSVHPRLSLLGLPTEIRVKILEMLFIESRWGEIPQTTQSGSHISFGHGPLLSIILTCKQMCNEGLPILYNQNYLPQCLRSGPGIRESQHQCFHSHRTQALVIIWPEFGAFRFMPVARWPRNPVLRKSRAERSQFQSLTVIRTYAQIHFLTICAVP